MFRAPLLCALALLSLTANAPAQNDVAAKPPSVGDVRGLMAEGKLDDASRELDVLARLQPEPAGLRTRPKR